MNDIRVYQDRYEVERELGRGGMSVVYLARDRQLLSRRVVVKELLGEMNQDPWLRKKLLQEMEALSRIDHPGVVGILGTGSTPEGNEYLVMQFVDGITLREALSGPMDLPRAGNLVRQIGNALQAAHDKGILHRDLKPANVMLQRLPDGEERAVLIDFGIAGIQNSAFGGEKTRVAGTSTYMAPEQFAGAPAATSDTYALGVVAYEMITGQKPFPANSFAHLVAEPKFETPRTLRPELPERAEHAVLRAMSFNPEARQARVCEFGDELCRVLTGEAVGRKARAENTPELAHVLFMDLVSFSLLSMDQQREYIQELQNLVRETPRFKEADAAGDLICLPRGDGMALVFFDDPTAPAQCAMQVAAALKNRPRLKLRMGIHTGPVYRVANVNAGADVAGGGINMAQRVMDSGDAGHILVSKTTADVLLQMRDWSSSLADLGEHTVKHGAKIHVYNLSTPLYGNPARPSRLGTSGRRLPFPLLAALLATLIAVAAGGWWIATRNGGGAQTQTAAADQLEVMYSLTRGPRVSIEIASRNAGFLYVVNEGQDPKLKRITFNVLHPRPGQLASFSPGTPVRLGPYNFDESSTPERLYLIWARDRVLEIESVRDKPQQDRTTVVSDLAEIEGIRDFLDRHLRNKVEVRRDVQNDRTELRTSDRVLVHAIRLERQ